jgi:hypothetical protein
MTNKIKKQIKKEVGDWELNPFTDASFDEVVEDVIYNMENYGEDMDTALQHTNDKIMDGCL